MLERTPITTGMRGMLGCPETLTRRLSSWNISALTLYVVTAAIVFTFPLGRYLYSFLDVVGRHPVEPSIWGQQFVLFSLWFSFVNFEGASSPLLQLDLEIINISFNWLNWFNFLFFMFLALLSFSLPPVRYIIFDVFVWYRHWVFFITIAWVYLLKLIKAWWLVFDVSLDCNFVDSGQKVSLVDVRVSSGVKLVILEVLVFYFPLFIIE